jgi:hypothetical protein
MEEFALNKPPEGYTAEEWEDLTEEEKEGILLDLSHPEREEEDSDGRVEPES